MKRIRDFLAGFAAAALILTLAVPATAAVLKDRTVTVQTGVGMYFNGSKVVPTDAYGNELDVILYNQNTYVPIRTVSQFFGADFWWDKDTQSVRISLPTGTGQTTPTVTTAKQDLLEVCPPYEKSNYYSTSSAIQMAGERYTKGFILDAYRSGSVYFNLNGKYTTLDLDVGHVDGSSIENARLDIYLDNNLVQTIDLNCGDLVHHKTVSLNGALQMKLTWTQTGGHAKYGFANPTIK